LRDAETVTVGVDDETDTTMEGTTRTTPTGLKADVNVTEDNITIEPLVDEEDVKESVVFGTTERIVEEFSTESYPTTEPAKDTVRTTETVMDIRDDSDVTTTTYDIDTSLAETTTLEATEPQGDLNVTEEVNVIEPHEDSRENVTESAIDDTTIKIDEEFSTEVYPATMIVKDFEQTTETYMDVRHDSGSTESTHDNDATSAEITTSKATEPQRDPNVTENVTIIEPHVDFEDVITESTLDETTRKIPKDSSTKIYPTTKPVTDGLQTTETYIGSHEDLDVTTFAYDFDTSLTENTTLNATEPKRDMNVTGDVTVIEPLVDLQDSSTEPSIDETTMKTSEGLSTELYSTTKTVTDAAQTTETYIDIREDLGVTESAYEIDTTLMETTTLKSTEPETDTVETDDVTIIEPLVPLRDVTESILDETTEKVVEERTTKSYPTTQTVTNDFGTTAHTYIHEDLEVTTSAHDTRESDDGTTISTKLSDSTDKTESKERPGFTPTQPSVGAVTQQTPEGKPVEESSMTTTDDEFVKGEAPIETTVQPDDKIISAVTTETATVNLTTASSTTMVSSTTMTPPPYLYQQPEADSGIKGYASAFPPFPGFGTTTWRPSTTPDFVIGPGACVFDGKVYVSAQQIVREDPCEFCFCFRGDIICLQQTCPPPVDGCSEEPIPGFCCPRYACPSTKAVVNITTTTTPLPTYPPIQQEQEFVMCEIEGKYYYEGEVVEEASSGPCLECRCGHEGMMECDPKACHASPMLGKIFSKGGRLTS